MEEECAKCKDVERCSALYKDKVVQVRGTIACNTWFKKEMGLLDNVEETNVVRNANLLPVKEGSEE